MKLLLMHDTNEKDLARDVKEFLDALGISAEMIIKMPDKGLTLHKKEELYLNITDGIVFLVTPGSERNGQQFPSPSINDELGRSKEMFKDNPERVIYMVEEGCNIAAIDQKAYIPFNRSNGRIMIEAMTQLVNNLRDAELLHVFAGEASNIRAEYGPESPSDEWKAKFANYQLTRTSGGAVVFQSQQGLKHFICPKCAEGKEIQILQDTRAYSGSYFCPKCKTMYPIDAPRTTPPDPGHSSLII